jgi:8-oxo-dGTP diphosphatase
MKYFILFIVAILLAIILFPIGFLFTMIKPKRNYYIKFKNYLFFISVSIDQMGNVVCGELFNSILIKEKIHLFGDEDETISSVMGRNKKINNLTILGKLLDWVLNKIDDDHTIKSIGY